MKVAILYSDVKPEYFPTEEAYLTEKDADVYAGAVAKYVAKMDIDVELFAGDDKLAAKLKKYQPDIAINLVDSVRGDETLAPAVSGMLEMLHVPYTGSGILGQSLNTNKYVIYQLLQNGGVPVPQHQLFTSPHQMIDPVLRYPLFAKLNNMHSSVAIDENSICSNERELRAKLKDMYDQYRQSILVDEFIAGKEVTVPVLDGLNTKVYPAERFFGAAEADKPEGYKFMTFKQKWVNWEDMGFAKYDNDYLRELARRAFELTKMSDYGRFDVRLDGAGRHYFIDANTNPFFGPPQETHSPYAMILAMYGVDFTEILKRLFLNTLKGTGTNGDVKPEVKENIDQLMQVKPRIPLSVSV